MTIYKNTIADSPLVKVEFAPIPEGNLSFFHVKSEADAAAVKQWLTTKEIGQQVLAETEVKSQRVLVTQGDRHRDELLKLLAEHGDQLQLVRRDKKMDPWRKVSMLAVPGQLLQLASSFMRKDRKLDWSMFTFAGANLLGHAIAWSYGAQKSDDVNRLKALKGEINETLEEHLANGDTLPSVDERRAQLRQEPQGALSAGEKANDFLKRNSVYVSEFACRYLGALALAFPTNKLKTKAWPELKQGNFKQAYYKGRASFKDRPDVATWSHYAGLGSLAGKTIALMSKPEDPYNPAPKGLLDTLREKYTFRTGGWIEAASFATYAADSFTNPDRRIVLSRRPNAKDYPDFIGGVGSILFTIRYITRHWAKFGVKELDMEELYAHVTDGLAKMPADKLPQLLAETAADITDHFKEKKLDFGDVYTKLMLDMYHYHHMPIEIAAETQKAAGSIPAAPAETVPPAAPAEARRTPRDYVAAPVGSYADAVKAGNKETPLGIGA